MTKDKKFPCPCCKYLTLTEGPPGTFEVCPVCYWEDDFAQFEDPHLEGGANEVCLDKAQQNFIAFGVSDERHKNNVRPPTPEETPLPSKKFI